MVISCIVEGHGDVRALPVLVRRIAAQVAPGLPVSVPRPWRVPKDKLLQRDELTRVVDRAGRIVDGPGGVLIVLDADDDCPATLGPTLLDMARAARPDRNIAVVLAKSEFEAWFLAAAASLAGRSGLPADLAPPLDPESIRGAKEWINRQIAGTQRYSETVDQVALTAVFDIGTARRRSDSFDKCCREITRLLGA